MHTDKGKKLNKYIKSFLSFGRHSHYVCPAHLCECAMRSNIDISCVIEITLPISIHRRVIDMLWVFMYNYIVFSSKQCFNALKTENDTKM
jgi:hypothetical protein